MYVIGEEECPTTKKIHIQGYIESDLKIRPKEKFKTSNVHWEKAKGTREQNIQYCIKDNKYKTNLPIRKKIKDPLDGLELYDWQKSILSIIETEPDKRKIYWFWDTKGNVGKTSLCKHLCLTKNALYLSGKSADIKTCIAEFLEKNDLDIALFDFVRSTEEFISYEAIEAVKNGIFFSGKYESKMCMFNIPHIICFANYPPDRKKLSEDRWEVFNLDPEEEVYDEPIGLTSFQTAI